MVDWMSSFDLEGLVLWIFSDVVILPVQGK